MEPHIVIRRGGPDDSRHCHEVLFASITGFEAEHGTPLKGTEEEWWADIQPYFEHLAEDAAEWWIAEEQETGSLLGFARSIDSGGLFELTEFFVRPGHQGRGLGRELLDRAFPANRGSTRAIIATRDVRALARYYATGMVARFPILGMSGATNAADAPGDMSVRRVDGEADIAALRSIDRSLLGFERTGAAWRCLIENREAYLYHRGDTAIGFALMSAGGSGPIAALDPADMPGILLHVEGRAQAIGMKRLSFEVPAPNEAATRHLLSRGFRFDPFVSFLLSDRPFGQFDRFIGFSPPLFL